MRLVLIVLLAAIGMYCSAQQKLIVRITETESGIPVLASLLLKGTKQGFKSDSLGIINISFPENKTYELVTSAVGHEEKQTRISIPFSSDTMDIQLERSVEEMDEVVVQSTRNSRTIANVPTRVETIEFEEIDEKNNMRPANVAMLLHESTGIQVQQTSATSANASIRIQGLDGRYTQLLKDGFPNYGNFSSGLSVLEIPPLDLKQVEIIKGPASPLFGGGAIAGVVNFVSKTPKSKPEYNFIINRSNIGQMNVGGFASGRAKKIGYTLLALYNTQKAYDVDEDDFTEVPKSKDFTVHPKLFFYPGEKTIITIGNSFTKGERTGGDIFVVNGKPDASHQYFEKNETLRNISTFALDRNIAEGKKIMVRQSFSVFDRSIFLSGYSFSGLDKNAYTDISFINNKDKHSLVIGSNFIYNDFREKGDQSLKRDNNMKTGGLYAQHTLDISEKFKLESGLRFDVARYTNELYSNTESFLLPRISLLLHYNSKLSSRIGAGMGYKTPTLFTEETETMQYRNVAQLKDVESENSYGATADVNFRTDISEDLSFSLNHMFFYTNINNPLVLEPAGNEFAFSNMVKPVHTLGFETNARFIFRENLKLFLGYTFNHSIAKYLPGNQFLPLVPKNKLNTALIYEKEDVIKVGLEGYFTGRQYLSDGSKTPAFKELGFMVEKLFGWFSIYINFENFTDTRQSRYKSVVNGTHANPTFDEIWTHTEGFVFNGGLKLKF